MSRNPLINALSALLYILLIASFMFYGLRNIDSDPSIFFPIIMLSLFTLSAAVMAFIFVYQPFLLFMEGKKKNAVDLFLQTVVIFGGITFTILLIFYLATSL